MLDHESVQLHRKIKELEDKCISYEKIIIEKNDELKKTDKEKKGFETNFSLLMDAIDENVWMWNLQNNTVHLSKAWKDMLGYNHKQSITSNLKELIHPDDFEIIKKELDSGLVRKSDNYSPKFRIKKIDGNWIDFLSHAKVYRENNKAIILVGKDNNVFEKEQLYSLNHDLLLQNVLSAIPDLISIHDNEFNIIYSNWNGLAKDMLIDKEKKIKCFDAYPIICDCTNGKCWATEVLKNKKPYQTIQKLRTERWIHVSILPLANKYGSCEIFIEWVRDITDQKETEHRLKEKNSEYESLNSQLMQLNDTLLVAKHKAEESNRLKVAFLNNISHEFHTPMNGILGFAELLSKQDITTEQRSFYIRNLNESSDRLLSIITDIVEISKMQSNTIDVNIDSCNIYSIIYESVQRINHRIQSKKLSIEIDINTEVTEYIDTDHYKVSRILQHVLDNAVKFTNSGNITIKCLKKTNSIVISVKDTGVGVPREMQQNIFESFMQVETGITRNFGGSGIGLALIKGYTELLGGQVFIESEVDKGTTLSFTLPIKSKIEN